MNMDNLVPSKTKAKNNKVRKMVKRLINNIEDVQEELLLLLDDLKDLVGQIDHVSSKLEKSVRNNWQDEADEATHLKTNEHNYVNIELQPRIQQIENKINARLSSQGQSKYDMTNSIFSPAHSCYCKAKRPNSFEKSLEGSVSNNNVTATNNSQKVEQLLDSADSPMLDLSYLDISQSDNRPKWGRSISLPIRVISRTVSPMLSPRIRPNRTFFTHSKELSEESRVPAAICFAELKPHYATNKPSSTSLTFDGVFNDTEVKSSSPATLTTVKSLTSSSVNSNISVDGDLYERRLEDELENISDVSYDSLIDYSDATMETRSNARTETYSENDERIDEMNTCASFTLNQMSESTKSSESFVSDTPSDIVNDNIWPHSNVRDIFSSTMLARKFNKHLDNDFVNDRL